MKGKGGLFVKAMVVILILVVVIIAVIIAYKTLFLGKKVKTISEESNLENDRALITLLSDLADILKKIEA